MSGVLGSRMSGPLMRDMSGVFARIYECSVYGTVHPPLSRQYTPSIALAGPANKSSVWSGRLFLLVVILRRQKKWFASIEGRYWLSFLFRLFSFNPLHLSSFDACPRAVAVDIRVTIFLDIKRGIMKCGDARD